MLRKSLIALAAIAVTAPLAMTSATAATTYGLTNPGTIRGLNPQPLPPR